MAISEKIQQIIAQRAKHLPKIRAMKEHLQKMLEKLEKLDSLVSVINNEIAQQKGDYYAMIAENPKMEITFHKVNSTQVRELITTQLKKLDDLEKRFDRSALRIAFIGRERQGKSTFLKTITGLNDKVIPAYSGDSCTGAVSVIHNYGDRLRVDVQYYNLDEFLEIVGEKIKKFYKTPIPLLQLSDIKRLPALENEDASTEYIKFKESYIDNYDEYCNLIGSGVVSYYDEDEVAHHVAQYEEFSEERPHSKKIIKDDESVVYKLSYYKYVAVKDVDIYTPFLVGDTQLLELVDTIGIGGAADSKVVEKEMYRVLREDCDAAIDLFRPENTSNFPVEQREILDGIWENLQDRDPSKWIVYVINRIPSGIFKNAAAADSVLEKVNAMFELQKTSRPVAWAKDVCGSSLEEVSNKLINPLLDLISTNLPDLDAHLMQDAYENGQKLYSAYYTLASLVQAVLSKSRIGGREGKVFDNLYNAQMKKLYTQLRILDEEEYGARRSNLCPEIADCLETTINSLYDLIPEVETIEEKVDQGNKSLNEIFGLGCDDLCNNIFKAFENVSLDVIVPLREEVKNAIAAVLYNQGSMGKIILKNYRASDGPNMEWLKCLIDERIDGENYPQLREALQYVLDYHFNIEDSIEYDVATSIGIIDKMNTAEYVGLYESPTGTVAERADALWQELANRIPPIQENMRKCRDKFALIPSHSFATRVQKFRVKMVFDEKICEELREFYRDNSYSLWRDEFAKVEGQEQAFGQWNEMVSEISELCNKEVFEFNK